MLDIFTFCNFVLACCCLPLLFTLMLSAISMEIQVPNPLLVDCRKISFPSPHNVLFIYMNWCYINGYRFCSQEIIHFFAYFVSCNLLEEQIFLWSWFRVREPVFLRVQATLFQLKPVLLCLKICIMILIHPQPPMEAAQPLYLPCWAEQGKYCWSNWSSLNFFAYTIELLTFSLWYEFFLDMIHLIFTFIISAIKERIWFDDCVLCKAGW